MGVADHYGVLGVLPEAEEIVITAAYRALAQRYHPDKWRGDPAEAHRKMLEINAAYQVLGDAARRSEYDRAQRSASAANQDYETASEQTYDEAFRDALEELEQRWEVAVGVFPDLTEQRNVLARISTSLAFTFVATLLHGKQFASRVALGAQLERAFLERYFGSNEKVLTYARGLITDGHRRAALKLNRLVEVVGSDVDPVLLISKVDEEEGVRVAREEAARVSTSRERHLQLVELVRAYSYYSEAFELAKLHGYIAKEVGGGMFRSATVAATSPTGETLSFPDPPAFVRWVQQRFC